jgi:hypothetical protein
VDERGALLHRTGVRKVRCLRLGQKAERRRLQLRADAVLDGKAQVGVEIEIGGQRLAGDVGAADQVRIVASGVVTSGGAVGVGKAADVPQQPAVAAKDARKVERDERLIDAELRLQVAVTGVGEVVGAHDHVGRRTLVPVREVQLRPGAGHVVGEAPVGIGAVGDLRRRVRLGAALHAFGEDRTLGLAEAEAHRRAQKAAELEAPGLVARRHCRGRLVRADQHVARLQRARRETETAWAGRALFTAVAAVGLRVGRGRRVGHGHARREHSQQDSILYASAHERMTLRGARSAP